MHSDKTMVKELGTKSFGTLEEFVRYSSIDEEPGQDPDVHAMETNTLALEIKRC